MDYVTLLEWLKTAIDVFDVDDEMSHMIELCQHWTSFFWHGLQHATADWIMSLLNFEGAISI
jgi:hypothetical protein